MPTVRELLLASFILALLVTFLFLVVYVIIGLILCVYRSLTLKDYNLLVGVDAMLSRATSNSLIVFSSIPIIVITSAIFKALEK